MCLVYSVDLLGFQNLNGHVIDCGIIKHNDAAVGSWFNVDTDIFAEFIIAATEVVSDGLYGYVEFISNLMSCAIGQAVFDATELVESDCFSHNRNIFRVNEISRFYDLDINIGLKNKMAKFFHQFFEST